MRHAHLLYSEDLPVPPTFPLLTNEVGFGELCRCPSWIEVGTPTDLAAGWAKMMLGSFRLTALWLEVEVLLLPDRVGKGTPLEWGGFPEVRMIWPWRGQLLLWIGIWGGKGRSPRLCRGEKWVGGECGKLNIGRWTWWAFDAWDACCCSFVCWGWDWFMEFCWNGWGE